MKLFKNIMSRKPDPEEIAALEAEAARAEELDRPGRVATADDSGGPNASINDADDLYPEITPGAPEPETTEGSGWSVSAWEDDDDEWDDEDWGDDWADGDDQPLDAQAEAKAALVDGIRDAARDIQGEGRRDQIRNWSEDEEFAQPDEDRILSRTNSELTSVMSSRRRSAMAHLKKAAQATKADRVLSHVVGRDAAGDPEEQSPYRDDLAKVVKPRATSRPVSRPVSRSPKIEAGWEAAPSDDDAGLMADAFEGADTPQADRSIFEAERQQHLPTDLSEDEFSSEEDLVAASEPASEPDDAGDDDDDDMPRGPASWSRPIFEAKDDDQAAVELATRRASRVRSSLVDMEDEDEDFDMGPAEAPETPEPEVAEANWGLGGAVAAAEAEDDDDEGDDWSAPSLDDAPAQTGGIDLAAVRSGVSEMSQSQAASPSKPDPAPTQASETPAKAEPAQSEAEAIVQVPTPAIGRAGRSAGRVKTRLLGFQTSEPEPDVFERADSGAAEGRSQFPVGWIVVAEGPGRGHAFTLKGGVMQIGRGAGQGVQLDFGDTAISRENHAAVAFDDETGKFFLGHGGKSNLVRLNGAPVLSTEELGNRDRIRIGETTLVFIALCDGEFTWSSSEGSDNGS